MHFGSEVRLQNMSLSGVCIISNKPLNIGEEYKLRFKSGVETLNVTGTVVWGKMEGSQKNKRGEVVPIYKTGIKFKDVLTRKGRNILDFIDNKTFLKRLSLRLSGVRVKLFRPKTRTLLGDHRSLKIIKLSQGGMLIESDHKLKKEKKFNMEISIPKTKLPIKFLGRIASCVKMPDTVPARYGIGIEFLEMNRRDVFRLNKFLKSIITPT